MSFGIHDTADVILTMEQYIDLNRPQENLRDKVDLSYRIEGQNIIIFELRNNFMEPAEWIESPIAKTTYSKAKDEWKIYWMRGNLKWQLYQTESLSTLEEVLEIVEEDEYGCFWG